MLRLHEYEYLRPRRVKDAVTLLGERAMSALPIGGGTDLVPNMKHRLFTPSALIALRQVEELQGIAVAGGELVIGAAETLATLSRHPLVLRHAPALAKAAGLVAGPQIRNAGTIGGNVCLETRCTYYNQSHFWRNALGYCLKKDGDTCHVTKVGRKCVAAHSADTVPVLMAIGAAFDLLSVAGARTVPAAEFFVSDGIWNTVRRRDEVLVRVRLPLRPNVRSSFGKLRQRGSIDFPVLNVAAAADMEGNVVRELNVVVSTLGARPRVLAGLEKIVSGHRLDADVIEAVAERAYQQCHPLTNIIVDPEWRKAMVPVYVRRALEELRA